MNIMILSQRGDGLGLAHRMTKEKNDVRLFIKEAGFEFSGLGLVNRIESWRPYLKDTNFAICDASGFGQYESVFKEHKIPIIGCSKIGDILNEDSAKAVELAEKLDIKVPKTWRLDEPSAGVSLMEEFPVKGVVVKTNYQGSTAKTIICRDKKTYFWALSRLSPNTRVVVQEMLYGTKVSIQGWFNGMSWMKPYLLCFDEREDLSRDGNYENTGTVIVTKRPAVRLIRDTLSKATPFLKSLSYKGPLNIDCIVNSDGIFVVDMNMKIHYDSIEAIAEGLEIPLAEFMYKLATSGTDEIKMKRYKNYVSIRLITPAQAEKADMPVNGLNKENSKHTFLHHVYKENDDIRFSADGDLVAKISAYGYDVREACNRVLRTANNIDFIDKRFNPSVGKRVDKDLLTLSSMGYI